MMEVNELCCSAVVSIPIYLLTFVVYLLKEMCMGIFFYFTSRKWAHIKLVYFTFLLSLTYSFIPLGHEGSEAWVLLLYYVLK